MNNGQQPQMQVDFSKTTAEVCEKCKINRALKNFKKKFRDTKTLQKLRDRKEYTKPSVAKRQAKEKAIIRDKYRRDNDE